MLMSTRPRQHQARLGLASVQAGAVLMFLCPAMSSHQHAHLDSSCVVSEGRSTHQLCLPLLVPVTHCCCCARVALQCSLGLARPLPGDLPLLRC
jgi:hypothetical protein